MSAQLVPAWDVAGRAQLVPAWVVPAGGGVELLTNFAGSTISAALSSIAGGSTSTPVATLVNRTPEGGSTAEWQTARGGFSGLASKAITVNIDCSKKNGGVPRSAYSGPWVNSSINNHEGWVSVASTRSISGDTLSFVIDGNVFGDTVYWAFMPPNTGPIALSWMQQLLAAHPDLVHDDMPERLSAGIAPFTLGTLPTARDETGRTIPGQPMYGVRIGDDSIGVPGRKPRVLLLAGVHPGEEHGPLVLRGFVHEWLTAPGMATIRQSHELWVYPHIAANGSWAGYQRHEPYWALPGGSDLNRGWSGTTSNGSALAWRNMLAARHHGPYTPMVSCIDCHDMSPGGGAPWYYWRDPEPRAEIKATFLAEFPAGVWHRTTNSDSTSRFMRDPTGYDTPFTMEVTDENGTPADYAAVGAGIARMVERQRAGGLLPVPVTPPAYELTPDAINAPVVLGALSWGYTPPGAEPPPEYAFTPDALASPVWLGSLAWAYTPPDITPPPTYIFTPDGLAAPVALGHVEWSYAPPDDAPEMSPTPGFSVRWGEANEMFEQSIHPAESVVVEFDFSKASPVVFMPTVEQRVLWSSAPHSGGDVRRGAPQIHGAAVRQRIGGVEDMTDYGLVCEVTTPAGDRLAAPAVLLARYRPK